MVLNSYLVNFVYVYCQMFNVQIHQSNIIYHHGKEQIFCRKNLLFHSGGFLIKVWKLDIWVLYIFSQKNRVTSTIVQLWRLFLLMEVTEQSLLLAVRIILAYCVARIYLLTHSTKVRMPPHIYNYAIEAWHCQLQQVSLLFLALKLNY